jgi:hypothetical protein
MRREELTNAVKRIVRDLQECGVEHSLAALMEEFGSPKHKDRGHVFPLSVFRKYVVAVSNYSDIEGAICKIFGLEGLLNNDFWEALQKTEDPGLLFRISNNVRFVCDHLPKVLDLLRQEHLVEIKEQRSELPEELKGKSLLNHLRVYSPPLAA